MNLEELGFTDKGYNETIIVAETINGYHAMPLGVILKDNELWCKIYKTSRLYKYIINNEVRKLSLCITTDPILFYKAIFHKEVEYTNIGKGWPCIKNCTACILVRLEETMDEKEYLEAILKPLKTIITAGYPRVYHRGEAALIEILVHYTKLPYLPENERKKLLEYIKALSYGLKKSTWDEEVLEALDEINKGIRKLSLPGQ